MKRISEVIRDLERDIEAYGDVEVHSFRIRTEQYSSESYALGPDGEKISYRKWLKFKNKGNEEKDAET